MLHYDAAPDSPRRTSRFRTFFHESNEVKKHGLAPCLEVLIPLVHQKWRGQRHRILRTGRSCVFRSRTEPHKSQDVVLSTSRSLKSNLLVRGGQCMLEVKHMACLRPRRMIWRAIDLFEQEPEDFYFPVH